MVWAHAAEVLEVPTEEEGVVLNLNDPETLRRALGGTRRYDSEAVEQRVERVLGKLAAVARGGRQAS